MIIYLFIDFVAEERVDSKGKGETKEKTEGKLWGRE